MHNVINYETIQCVRDFKKLYIFPQIFNQFELCCFYVTEDLKKNYFRYIL